MSFSFSSKHTLYKLGQIFDDIDGNLIELYNKTTNNYSNFLQSDFYNLLKNCKMKEDMKNTFNLKYIYYFLKSHKILLDYMSYDKTEFKNRITIPCIPLNDQIKIVYSIQRSRYQIKNKFKQNICDNCKNNINIDDKYDEFNIININNTRDVSNIINIDYKNDKYDRYDSKLNKYDKYSKLNKYNYKLYDDIIHLFNIIIHHGIDDMNKCDQERYVYYGNHIDSSKKIIMI